MDRNSELPRGNRRNRPNDDSFFSYASYITTFKDFQNSRLSYVIPEKYEELQFQEKRAHWQKQLERLCSQNEKVCFHLSDKQSEDEVKMIIELVENLNKSKKKEVLNYEFDSFYLGNKKQLLIYLKCREMESFLQIYKLPKIYPPAMEKFDKVASKIFEAQVERNIAISKLEMEKVKNVSNELNQLKNNFEKQFIEFSKILGKIFDHFKGQQKRKTIQLSEVRLSILEKIKELSIQHGLYASPKYRQIGQDQVICVIVSKNMPYFEEEQYNKLESDEQVLDDNISSCQSDFSYQETVDKAKDKAPEISHITYIGFKQGCVLLKIMFSGSLFSRVPFKLKIRLTSFSDFKEVSTIQSVAKFEDVSIQIEQNGYFNVEFITQNQIGASKPYKFQYLLRLDNTLKSQMKNKKLFFLGESQTLIPKEKTEKVDNQYRIQLPSIDFSISSSQVLIIDEQLNVAEWGEIRQNQGNINKKQKIQENQLFCIEAPKETYQLCQPALFAEKMYRVSCGNHYALLLDCHGKVWSYGGNSAKQLGLIAKEFNPSEKNLIQYFPDNNIFIIDIKATQIGASFAIGSDGTLYKWGYGQVNNTPYPVTDRFGCVSNFTYMNDFITQHFPIASKKAYKGQVIVQVKAGNEFYYALNSQGTLYGWGQCRNLGIQTLLDTDSEEVYSICQPIELMKQVKKISVGRNHSIVVKKDGSIFGWGSKNGFSNIENKKQFVKKPVNLTQLFSGKLKENDILECGANYTCLYRFEQKKIKLFGTQLAFKQRECTIEKPITKIECSDQVLAFL